MGGVCDFTIAAASGDVTNAARRGLSFACRGGQSPPPPTFVSTTNSILINLNQSQPISTKANYRGSGPGAYGSYMPVTSVSHRRPQTQRGLPISVVSVSATSQLQRSLLALPAAPPTHRWQHLSSRRSRTLLGSSLHYSCTHPPHHCKREVSSRSTHQGRAARGAYTASASYQLSTQGGNGHSARELRTYHRACACTVHLYQRTHTREFSLSSRVRMCRMLYPVVTEGTCRGGAVAAASYICQYHQFNPNQSQSISTNLN